jgi:hypothetical protein
MYLVEVVIEKIQKNAAEVSFSFVASVFNEISGCSRRRGKKRFPLVCLSVWAEVHNELLLTFRVRTMAVTMKQDQVDRAHTHTLSRSDENLPAGQNQTLGIVYFFIYIVFAAACSTTHTHASILQPL